MKFGIREVCNCYFYKLPYTPGNDPAFAIDTAKMTTLDSQSSTVYAQGGWGNSRLMAWEGDRTLTFTVEDALLTFEAFQALSGNNIIDTTVNGKRIKKIAITAKKFAGYYRVEADTLFRNEDGEDMPAKIILPRTKLQSTLNIPMSPTGDPAAFTFTFDAFPGADEDKTICSIEVETEDSGEPVVTEDDKINVVIVDSTDAATPVVYRQAITPTSGVALLETDHEVIKLDDTIISTVKTPTTTKTLFTDGMHEFTHKLLYAGNNYYFDFLKEV